MREFLKELSFRRLVDSLKLTPKHRLLEHMGGNISLVLYDFNCCASNGNYNCVILLAGIITPIIPSAFTSALLSAIFYAASVEIKPFFCFLLGVGQTGIILFFSFLKILSTL
ncbi:unnamed protein product [Adineta ricciae]|uniref:Uncharacterized protein n=1 Tax=Adineta ricciae TaxID=249248 RepID=A0A815RIF2_ADIRI|nr:unnamed protein product [Adineta ricciae]